MPTSSCLTFRQPTLVGVSACIDLPFVRNEVTVPDTPFGSATVRQLNLPGVMRLAGSQVSLLQKPVAAQPQMIELVPDPKLVPGLYAVLYAPATAVTLGAGAGQSTGWTALLSVGQSSAPGSGGQCIDLILTGGLGGMLGIDSPDKGSIASFPLLDPGRAPACSASVSSASPAVAPSTPATRGSARTLADLQNDIDGGKEVSLPVKYNSAIPGYVYMADGLVTLSKTAFEFKPTYGSEPFSISPDKILQVVNQPQQASIYVKVAVKNKKGNKEDKKDYYFYSAGARAVGGGQGGAGASISCSGCDDSMNILYGLLTGSR